MEWLEAAQREAGLAGLVRLRPVAGQRLIRHDIVTQSKPDAQLLGEPVGAIQRADLITAHDPPDAFAACRAGS